MDLPDRLRTRALDIDDAPAVTAVIAAEEVACLGRALIETADVVADWSRSDRDLAGTTIGVFDDDVLIGYAEVSGRGRGDAAVLPERQGHGIGTFLAEWMQRRARELGHDEIAMSIPAGSPSEKLMRALGYELRYNAWSLVLPEGRQIPDRELPEGYTLAVALSDADREGAWHVTEDAFLEWSDRPKDSYADWSTRVTNRPGFEPWMLRVVRDPAGEVVGAVSIQMTDTEGYVDKVAVRKDQRGRGIAQALLVDAFAAAREHGAERSELATDSRTGALDLYLKIGMEISEDWVNLGTRL